MTHPEECIHGIEYYETKQAPQLRVKANPYIMKTPVSLIPPVYVGITVK